MPRDERLHVLDGPWAAMDFPQTARWLGRHCASLNAVRDALLTRPRVVWPAVAQDRAGPLPAGPSARSATVFTGLHARALRSIHRGDLDEAWRDLFAILAWEGAEPGVQTAGLTHRGVMHLLNHPALTHEDAQRIHADLQTRRTTADVGWAFDRYRVLDAYQRVVSGRLDAETAYARLGGNGGASDPAPGVAWGDVPGFDADAGFAVIHHWMDRFDALRLRPASTHAAQAAELLEAMRATLSPNAQQRVQTWRPGDATDGLPEAMALAFAFAAIPDWPWFFDDDVWYQASDDLMRLAAAQRLHALTRGDFAADWQALLDAGLIDALPIDPMADPPRPYGLLIDADGCTLYSVGSDFDDDRGTDRFAASFTPADEDDTGDLVVRLTRPR